MTRYEQGFMSKCAEYGLDTGTVIGLLEKSARIKAKHAISALALALAGYGASRAFNTDILGGKVQMDPGGGDGESKSKLVPNGDEGKGKKSGDSGKSSGGYFNDDINYTKRRHLVNILEGGGTGAATGLALGIPAATATTLLSRNRGLRIAAGILKNPAKAGRYNRYLRRLGKSIGRKGLILIPALSALTGAGLADAKSRIRAWQDKDPMLDTVAIGRE